MPADSLPRMDANNTGNEMNAQEHLLSTSPGTSSLRSRTDSESSEKSTLFLLPSTDGSPPKVMTFNEVTDVVKNIQNMELAHEIALNPEFKFEPYEPPVDSLERRVRDMMHKAFWDILREELSQTPPCYDNALQLLTEIKECFPQILSQNNVRTLEHINEVLDIVVIKQQIQSETLDFKSYADFIIHIMSKSCAPARDASIRKLNEITDVVDMFKSILDMMTVMKLDMVNYLLDFARNDILANSVQYEKGKFREYLEYYKFGFPATENWIKRNRIPDNKNIDHSLTNAYLEFVDWDDSIEFPEVISSDKGRILKYCNRARRLCVCASLISICSAFPIIGQRNDNRKELAKQLQILLQDCNGDKAISEAMENVWLQMKTFINDCFVKAEQPVMEESMEKLLKEQILQIANKESPVRCLMLKRLKTYIRLLLIVKNSIPPPPPGFVDFKEELEPYAAALKRVIAYNHSVFGEYLTQIAKKQEELENGASGTQSDTKESSEMKTNRTHDEMSKVIDDQSINVEAVSN